MTPPQARIILALVCRITRKTTIYERSRNRLAKRFHAQLVRVLNFAKHETLRKLHRHLYSHRPLYGADQPPDHPDANKAAFDKEELLRDLFSMLDTEIPFTLTNAADDTLANVGSAQPFQLASQDVLDFIARRQNLLSDVPDEIFAQIRDQISEGMNAGESIADISQRISDSFDEISSGRAALIADTEAAAAYNFASNKAQVAAGVQYKQWKHGSPKVPRPDHLGIDGLIVPIDQPFPVGDPQLMYPHDENGSPEDVINCTCISIPATEEDFNSQ